MIEIKKGDRVRNVYGEEFEVIKRRRNRDTKEIILILQDRSKQQCEVVQDMIYAVPKVGDECIVIPTQYWEWRWGQVRQMRDRGEEWNALRESRELDEQMLKPLPWEVEKLTVRKVAGSMALVKGENFNGSLPLKALAVLNRPVVSKQEVA